MSKNRVWIAAVAAFVLCFANLLCAETAPSTNPDAMVDVLKTLESKGVINHQEYETLKAKVTEQAQQPQLKTVAMQEAAEGKAMNVVSAMDSGVGFHTGRFDVAFSGEVNGFYVNDRPDHTFTPGLAGNCVLCQTNSDPGAHRTSSIRSGLLPSDLSVKISTQEHGWDVAVFFGLWPAIQSNNVTPSVETGIVSPTVAGGTSGIDMRQNFATLGHPHFGTLKIGRDLGLLGQEGILNDMTLLGVGSTNASNRFPSNVTFGRIGVGYVYTDFLPQITYTTPSMRGLQAAVSAIQPLDDPFAGSVFGPGVDATGHGEPMIQAKLTFTAPLHGPVKAKFWGNMMTQDLESPSSDAAVRTWGVDYGAKLNFHGLELVGYGYNGWGLGQTALLFGGLGTEGGTGAPEARRSEGWYGQLSYTAHKNTFGFSYGQSNLSPTRGDLEGFTPAFANLMRNNSSYVAQYRYAVTRWDNLVAEWSHTISQNQARVRGTDDAMSFGTIVFF